MTETLKLTADQTAAWNMVADFVNDQAPELPEVALLGFAGTGKTFLVRALTAMLSERGHQVACTAPTNKAVHELRRGVEAGGWVRYCTLHSFLGLKPVIDQRTGEERFLPDPTKAVGDADLLVVDEASMVGHELYLLTHRTKRKETKILWVGDPAQLPPVNEADSQALLCPTQTTLREVVRYGNAIERYVTAVREAVEAGEPDVPPPSDCHDGGEGLFVLPKKEWMARLIEDFRSEEFRKDPGFVRALAWRNNLVDWGNRVIHQQLYGADAPPFVEGQVLVARTPVFLPSDERKNDIVMATSDECRVASAERATHNGFACWRLKVVTDDGSTRTLHAVDQAAGGLKLKLEELKLNALNEQDSGQRGRRWREYYRLREAFADMGPAYWSTVHKAQGSTFTRAYVAGDDVRANPDVRERNRMLYTSYTRASKQLVLTE